MAIGNVIGKSMGNGFAGSYSRQPDMIVDTHAAGSDDISFGEAVTYAGDKVVSIPAHLLTASTFTASKFAGVTTREVKSAIEYVQNSPIKFTLGEATPVMKRGRINVVCQNGTPEFNGDVYLRVETNESYPNAVVGGFEAASDSTKSVKLTNAKWRGTKDANGIAELAIIEQINA